MLQTVLMTIVILFSVIGFSAVLYLLFECLMLRETEWYADMTICARLTEDTPIEPLAETADYLCARYFPEMAVVFICAGLSEEKRKEALLVARDYGIEVR